MQITDFRIAYTLIPSEWKPIQTTKHLSSIARGQFLRRAGTEARPYDPDNDPGDRRQPDNNPDRDASTDDDPRQAAATITIPERRDSPPDDELGQPSPPVGRQARKWPDTYGTLTSSAGHARPLQYLASERPLYDDHLISSDCECVLKSGGAPALPLFPLSSTFTGPYPKAR